MSICPFPIWIFSSGTHAQRKSASFDVWTAVILEIAIPFIESPVVVQNVHYDSILLHFHYFLFISNFSYVSFPFSPNTSSVSLRNKLIRAPVSSRYWNVCRLRLQGLLKLQAEVLLDLPWMRLLLLWYHYSYAKADDGSHYWHCSPRLIHQFL